MSTTASDILKQVNSIIDLEAAEPTGSELTLRINYINQAIEEAAETGHFSEFDTIYEVGISNNITVPLPANFRDLRGNIRLYDSNGSYNEYSEIDPQMRFDPNYKNERVFYVMGNRKDGYYAIFHALLTNATLSMVYQRYPSGITTLTDNIDFSDATYVSRKVESYVLYSRSDDRFPIAQAMAERKLANMYGKEAKTAGGQPRRTGASFKNPLR